MSSIDEARSGAQTLDATPIPKWAKGWLSRHVELLLRLAGVLSVTSGLVGGFIWLVDLEDRSDGDALRLGFWRNPFMQFPPFHEAFLDLSMWVLLACSAAVGLGGVALLVPLKWGIPLVTWQARISIITHSVIAFFIVALMFVIANNAWDHWRLAGWYLAGSSKALVLRLGSIALDLVLWICLSSSLVREFFIQRSHSPERAFEVMMKR